MDDGGSWGQIKMGLLQSSVKGTNKMSVFCHNGIVAVAEVGVNGSEAGTKAVRIATRFRG